MPQKTKKAPKPLKNQGFGGFGSLFPINRDKENAVISRLFSMFSINLVQAKSSKNKGF
ncbi:MAG: hypothetical protein ACLRH2_14935 [Faecalibacterium prausnitzii]